MHFGEVHAFSIREPLEARLEFESQGVNNMRQIALIIAMVVSLLSLAAAAQEVRSEISLQGTGFFTKDSTGQGTTQHGTQTGGFLVGYRYHLNRWLAAETVYGYNRNTQEYFGSAGLARVQADIHQATGGFVVSLPTSAKWRFSPYLLAEGGALVFDPTGNSFGSVPGARRQAVGVFTYGGGVDYGLVKHLSLRAEYRGLVYNTPDFGLTNLRVDKVTHTAQPSAGVVFRF
ncbi:MAG TPA: outer membrane beta-barrel protein [Terriglobales bacterium]|nr:outer membrane beta-barrel protein [Terriglobales bacterium]